MLVDSLRVKASFVVMLSSHTWRGEMSVLLAWELSFILVYDPILTFFSLSVFVLDTECGKFCRLWWNVLKTSLITTRVWYFRTIGHFLLCLDYLYHYYMIDNLIMIDHFSTPECWYMLFTLKEWCWRWTIRRVMNL